MKKSIEIELRAVLNQSQHDQLLEFLMKNADDLGQDDKNVYFFEIKNKILKVVDEQSKQKAKIVLKLKDVVDGNDFEEYEVPINLSDIPKAIKIFQNLGFSKVNQAFQRRRNFIYQKVEIAVKYSDNWGYHAEFEILINNLAKKEIAERKIYDLASKLGVKIATQKEIDQIVARIKEKNASI